MGLSVEKSLLEIDFAALSRGTFIPSPAAWEDQVLYFLMLDRFSDGKERGGYADASGRPVESGATAGRACAAMTRLESDRTKRRVAEAVGARSEAGRIGCGLPAGRWPSRCAVLSPA